MSHAVDTLSALTHSLTQSHHLPLFAHFTLAILMATALTQQDAHVCESSEHACAHRVAYSFLLWGLLRMSVHLSGHVWCHNTDTSTASNIAEQNWGCCEALFFFFFFHSRIPAASSVSRQELHLCHRYAYIDKELQRLQTQGFQRQTNWLENATAELWHHWDYFWRQPIIVGDVRLGGSVSTICAAVACNSDQEE